MKQRLFLIILFLTLLFLTTQSVLAQNTVEKRTRVGNAPIGSGARVTPPPPPENLATAIQQQFGITMIGFGRPHLQWAWEKFWDVSHTRFTELAKGTTITATTAVSEQLGCRKIILNPQTSGDQFKVVLFHELGHIIDHCPPDTQSFKTEHARVFLHEGPITGYAEFSCYGTPKVDEDYAEMITYYLNPTVKEVINCHNRGTFPFANGKYPMHFELARKILGEY